MRTKNAMQLKARINAKAKEAGIPAQSLMQSYLFERFLERLSKSKWHDNVIIKGGMLISSLAGVASRTTMDLDTTITGFALTHESAERVFSEVAAVDANDDWNFEFERIEDIRVRDLSLLDFRFAFGKSGKQFFIKTLIQWINGLMPIKK